MGSGRPLKRHLSVIEPRGYLHYWFVINLLYEPNKVLVGCVERGIIVRDTYQVTSVAGNFGSEDEGIGMLNAAGPFPQALLQCVISSLTISSISLSFKHHLLSRF